MTTAGTLQRLGVDRNRYPRLYEMSLDWAIDELRKIRVRDAEWDRSLDEGPHGRNEQDRAYAEWRDSQ